MLDPRLAICALVSIGAHYALERGLHHLPQRVDKPLPQQVSVRVIEPDPPKEPEKPPEPPKPEPKQVATVPKAAPRQISVAPVASTAPPAEHAVQTDATSNEPPVFGVTMQSTSQQGGTQITTGNTLAPTAGTGSATKAAPPPVAAFEATKLPLPQGRCFGQYTDEARAAGIEGTVVLDLTVDESGKARDVVVVTGLDHGLSDAAKKALIACRFTPGEKDGKPVAVRIRGFKIQFVLQEH